MKKIIHIRDIFWLAVPVIALLCFMTVYKVSMDRSRADDTEDVNAVIDDFQEAYSGRNLTDLTVLFYGDAVIAWDATDGAEQRIFRVSEWLQNTQEYVFEENEHLSDVLSNREIQVYRNIACVVCDYDYTSDTKHGAGVDIFTLMKQRDHWKIVSLQWAGDEAAR